MSYKPTTSFSEAFGDAIDAFIDGLNTYRSTVKLTPEESQKLKQALLDDETEKGGALRTILENVFKETLPEKYKEYFTYHELTGKERISNQRQE